jgi:glutathione S-transferase
VTCPAANLYVPQRIALFSERMTTELTLVGRSSSHFTRIARIYAAELNVAYTFEPVLELMSADAAVFGDNPLLTVPSLRSPEGTWFGSLNTSRALARHAQGPGALLWPEDLVEPQSANAQEVVLSAMSAGVVVIMARNAKLADDHPAMVKPLARLRGSIAWLERHLTAAVSSLPARRLSFLEVSAFSFLTHLTFRQLGTLDGCPTLGRFCAEFGERPAARATEYAFDQPRH